MQPLHQRAISYQKITLLYKRVSLVYQVVVGLLNLRTMLVDLPSSMKLSGTINRLSGVEKNIDNAISFLQVQDGVLESAGKFGQNG